MFFEQQIGILEWFKKDHVTLKTAVMTAENPALPSQNKLHFVFKYTDRQQFNSNNILQ